MAPVHVLDDEAESLVLGVFLAEHLSHDLLHREYLARCFLGKLQILFVGHQRTGEVRLQILPVIPKQEGLILHRENPLGVRTLDT